MRSVTQRLDDAQKLYLDVARLQDTTESSILASETTPHVGGVLGVEAKVSRLRLSCFPTTRIAKQNFRSEKRTCDKSGRLHQLSLMSQSTS